MGTSNSQRASIISSPLLNRVAESMVIFRPMLQVGCLRACSSVTCSRSSFFQVRKGPPDAVRIRRETASGPPWLPFRHWKMALCSLSTGSTCTPAWRAFSMTIWPAMTRISLLAMARPLPASMAASAGLRPAVPTMEISTMSASGSRARRHRPSSPVSTWAPGRARASLSAPDGSKMHTLRTLNSLAWRASASTLVPAASPTISILSGMSRATFRALVPMEPVEPRMTTRRFCITEKHDAKNTAP